MNHIKGKLAVLGGDLRQIALAAKLAGMGYTIEIWGLGKPSAQFGGAVVRDNWQDALCDADAVILPLPVSSDGVRLNCPLAGEVAPLRLTVLFDYVKDRVPVLGGRCSPMVKSAAESRGVRLTDYFDSEELQIRNAIPTAEGAIAIAMDTMPITVDGCRAAVIGYGRVGRVLAEKLKLLGARVTVAARKPCDLAWIENQGMTPLRITYRDGKSSLSKLADGCDVIFNTVPYWLFDNKLVSTLPPELLFIDLASAPGGIDVRAAKEHGLHVIWALSLPGKCAPFTAGRILADTLLGLLGEEEVST